MTRRELSAELVASFTTMAEAEMAGLRRFALAVCGEPHRSDDLVQGALERVYAVWPRVQGMEWPGAYVRTVLVRLAVREQRSARWRREASTESFEATDALGTVGRDDMEALPDRIDLQQLLASLSVKQRAVLVLRFVEDRSVAETAAVLGVGEGTVKRTSHDALALLRYRYVLVGPTDVPTDLRSAR